MIVSADALVFILKVLDCILLYYSYRATVIINMILDFVGARTLTQNLLYGSTHWLKLDSLLSFVFYFSVKLSTTSGLNTSISVL